MRTTGREIPLEKIGTIPALRDRTDEIVDEITAPDGDECPYCGSRSPNRDRRSVRSAVAPLTRHDISRPKIGTVLYFRQT